MATSGETTVQGMVREYYGKDLTGTSSLKTSACCVGGGMPASLRALLKNIHPDVLDRFYGCGSPLPDMLNGLTVLDLGCGTGRDVYIAAQLVGPCGRAIGVDMTREQLDVAEEHEDWHRDKFGFAKANTLFVEATLENLKRAGIADNSVDVIISNCVLNLTADKEVVYREIWRVLKPGGELYYSDIFCDRRVPEAAKADKVLWGECLSGALYTGDHDRMLQRVGFKAHWKTASRVVTVDDPALRAALGDTVFYSETVRAIKVAPRPLAAPAAAAGAGAGAAGGASSDGTSPAAAAASVADLLLEDGSEDYGQTATYNGSIPGFPHAWSLGLGPGNTFITGVPTSVDGNTAAALVCSRYAAAFAVTARGAHRGAWRPAGYSAASTLPTQADGAVAGPSSASGCCPPSSTGAGGKCC